MNRKQHQFIMVVIIIITAMVFHINSYSSNKPLAELYFYNHGKVSDSRGSVGSFNSTQYKTLTRDNFNSMGYDAYAVTGAPAGPKSNASIMRTLGKDAIFMINAHAGKGRMICVSNGNITRLSANSQNYSTNYSLAYNFGNTTAQLNKMKPAFWMGCHTYGKDTSTGYAYGSLNDKCKELGVDCIITTKTSTWVPYSSFFLEGFAFNANKGYTVSKSISKAKAATLNKYLGSGPYTTSDSAYITANACIITGAASNPGAIKLKPASYGTN